MDLLFSILHVVGSVFIIGPMAILPMTGLRAIRAGAGGQVTTLAKSVTIFSVLSLLVVIFGFALLGVSDPKYHLSFTTSWIWISLVAYVIAAGLNLFLVAPALRDAGTRLQDGKSVAAGAHPRISAGSGLASLLLVLIVVLMVWKP